MPLPLLWLGAAVLGAAAVKELEQKRKQQELMRDNSEQITTRGSIHKHDSGMAK